MANGFNPYRVAGAGSNWIDEYFKLNQAQKESIALGKQQKKKVGTEFNKDVKRIEKEIEKAQKKRKKSWLEKAFGDFAPILTGIVGAFTGNPALMIAGGVGSGIKAGYDMDQQGKFTKKRSSRAISAIDKATPKYKGLYIDAEERLDPARESMIDLRDAAGEMRNPLNLLLQSGVEGAKTYYASKASSDILNNLFTETTIPGEAIEGAVAGTTEYLPDTVMRKFQPFKALKGMDFKNLMKEGVDKEQLMPLIMLLAELQGSLKR